MKKPTHNASTPDTRLAKKPAGNDGSLPTMTYDWKVMPRTAENIWHAQQAGWERILTYDYVADTKGRKENRRAKREEGLDRAGVPSSMESWRDEYPFACTIENAGSVFVGHAPAAEQRAQGHLINAFIRKHHPPALQEGRLLYFEVEVINMPVDLIDAAQKGKPRPIAKS